MSRCGDVCAGVTGVVTAEVVFGVSEDFCCGFTTARGTLMKIRLSMIVQVEVLQGDAI